MIIHISMAKYKESAQGRTKQENMLLGKQKTEAMAAQTPSIKRIMVGINMLAVPNAYDVVSYSEYEDMKAVEATETNPAHDELIAFLHEVVEISHAVTFELATEKVVSGYDEAVAG